MTQTIYNVILGEADIKAIFYEGLTPSEHISNLVDTVGDMNLQQGIDNSLDAKLDSALNALDDVNQNNDVAAINSLQAFINAVEAQRDNKLTDDQASTLVEAAQGIIDSLSNGSSAPGRQGSQNPMGKSTTVWGRIKNGQ